MFFPRWSTCRSKQINKIRTKFCIVKYICSTYLHINIFVHISMNIFGEKTFVHLILHINKQTRMYNICPPCPHIDQYIWTRIFVHILKNILRQKKHLFTLFLPLLATFLQWWKARLIAGRQSKRSPTFKTCLSWSWSSCSPLTIIIMFTHDHTGYQAGSWRDRRPCK